MKYYLFILGCQMNYSDAERISAVLEDLGYKKTDDEKKANLIIVVSCSVRQKAIDRIWGLAKKIQKLSTINHRPLTILTGCVLPADKIKLGKYFDIVLDIKELPKLQQFLSDKKSATSNKKKMIPNRILHIAEYFGIQPKYSSPFSAYTPIMTGCNNFCSYCAVPYTRGREISRPADEIICEVKNLIKRGYKEIILLGQNVNSYGGNVQDVQDVQDVEDVGNVKNKQLQQAKRYNKSNKRNYITFPELLRKINNISGKFWIRFLTSHPKDMSDDLIKVISEGEKITPYIHLPFQSGNNEILAKMNRGYIVEHYLDLVSRIKCQVSGVVLSTDIIVGFPGETKKQFQDTANLMKKVKFDMAYLSEYSSRPGTAASKLKDNVPKKEKERRKKELNKILKKSALENNKKYINQELEVLVATSNKKSEIRNKKTLSPIADRLSLLSGRTKNFKLIQFIGPKNLVGKFVKVKITKCTPWAMEGVLATCDK